jgi:CDP-diglyceride synthetase
LRLDWTFAEAIVLGLTAWHWGLLRKDGPQDMNATVFAIIGYAALLLILARVLGAIWLPLVTASYALAGAALLVASREGEGRKSLLRLGGVTMVIVVGRLIIVDMSSVETIWRVLLFLACGVGFVATSYRMQPGRAVPSVGNTSA